MKLDKTLDDSENRPSATPPAMYDEEMGENPSVDDCSLLLSLEDQSIDPPCEQMDDCVELEDLFIDDKKFVIECLDLK